MVLASTVVADYYLYIQRSIPLLAARLAKLGRLFCRQKRCITRSNQG